MSAFRSTSVFRLPFFELRRYDVQECAAPLLTEDGPFDLEPSHELAAVVAVHVPHEWTGVEVECPPWFA